MRSSTILAPFFAVTMAACAGDSSGPPPPPPPPADLVATGDWVGDWRSLDNDFVRFTTVITDLGGLLSGGCKFEAQSLLPLFLACDSVTGTRTGDHLVATVFLILSFQSITDNSFLFSGTLQPGVMVGNFGTGNFEGYEFRPRSATRNNAVPLTGTMQGTDDYDELVETLRRLTTQTGTFDE